MQTNAKKKTDAIDVILFIKKKKDVVACTSHNRYDDRTNLSVLFSKKKVNKIIDEIFVKTLQSHIEIHTCIVV